MVASPADVGLFFSIFPDALTAFRIAQIARRCRRDLGLRGEPLAASRLHISLQYLGRYLEMPETVVAKARAAAARVRMPPFAVMLDRAISFSGRADNYPLVLLGDDGVVGLRMLYRSLGAQMRKVGLRARSDFTPHMTLIYDSRRIDEEPIEPICWTVGELVLVQSLIGETKHVRLGRWPLRG
jgi:RNA 2',3'-cyclic 3'-phosphodiesterase